MGDFQVGDERAEAGLAEELHRLGAVARELGHLPATPQVHPACTVNDPHDIDDARLPEFKHLNGETHAGTSIVREYPQAEGDPYYPVPRPENEALFKKYAEMGEQAEGVTFVGRLAQYRYYNMDQIVAAALKTAQDLLEGGGAA